MTFVTRRDWWSRASMQLQMARFSLLVWLVVMLITMLYVLQILPIPFHELIQLPARHLAPCPGMAAPC